MNAIKRFVVLSLLAVWCFPAVSLAAPTPASPPPLPAVVTSTSAATTSETRGTGAAETAQLAEREKQTNVQDFKGGEGVSIYVGSSVLLALVVVLLILLLL